MTVGKSLFMADYGSPQDRAAHLDAAFSKLPNTEAHEMQLTDAHIKENPHRQAYFGMWGAVRKPGANEVLDRAYVHPNHIIRSMAIRAASFNRDVDMIKKMTPALMNDPHPYVVSQLVEKAPGYIPDEKLKDIAETHPDYGTRGKASTNYMERHIFKSP
jgi:hypothetical protein